MKSPYPPYSEAVLRSQPAIEEYKGEKFPITEIFWFDPVTGHTFDTVETGNVAIKQVYNAYRTKHGLPFPDEFSSLRKRLGLSAAKMSAMLGLGVNQYRLYEKGDMPADAVGKYIKMLIGNNSALKDCLVSAKEELTPREYGEALKALEQPFEDEASRKLLLGRNKENGYAPLDPQRMQNTILHFINQLGPISPTYLNKLLFYADFMSYRNRGMAISGLSYRALPYGPVPNNWKYIPLIEGIDQEEAEMGTLLRSDLKADYGCFDEEETSILLSVAERFKEMNASSISALSHQEEAWLQSKEDVHIPISFDHAFTLKAL